MTTEDYQSLQHSYDLLRQQALALIADMVQAEGELKLIGRAFKSDITERLASFNKFMEGES